MDQTAIQNAIKTYVSQVKNEIGESEAYLVGSYAKGTVNQNSDIDILIVSPTLSKYDTDERSRILYRASVGFPYDLHVYGVTPEEMASASPLTTLGHMREESMIRIQTDQKLT